MGAGRVKRRRRRTGETGAASLYQGRQAPPPFPQGAVRGMEPTVYANDKMQTGVLAALIGLGLPALIALILAV